jgi:hypothetical protein
MRGSSDLDLETIVNSSPEQYAAAAIANWTVSDIENLC